MDAAAGFGMPDAGAFLDRVHRRQRLDAEFGIDPAPRKVVENVDIMAGIREMQGCGPADKTITAKDCNLHVRFSC